MLIELGQRSPFLTSSLRSFGKDRSRLGRLALVIDKRKADRWKSFLALRCFQVSSAPLMAFISWRLPLLSLYEWLQWSHLWNNPPLSFLAAELLLGNSASEISRAELMQSHPRCCPAQFAFVGSRAEWLLYVVPKLCAECCGSVNCFHGLCKELYRMGVLPVLWTLLILRSSWVFSIASH